ncbi:cytochrome C [Geminicoccus flavidas]|uniref:cytochrome C n=1 Tax=Geminicoccus flavidas TaxID=2506407 RepID=UPI0013578691|nr:cytochrome C [Geminicoccus flavidas]
MAMKRTILGWRSVVMAGALALGAAALPGAAGAGDDSARIRQGYKIAPVKLTIGNRNRALVGLGSYIVNAQGGCNDCHTNPPFAEGGDPFKGQKTRINTKGYLAGGVPFGPVTSRNITPYKNSRPAGLTFREFRRVMRTGHSPNKRGILQVMPWPVYGNMNERDLVAIYVYLRSIPAIRPKSGG